MRTVKKRIKSLFAFLIAFLIMANTAFPVYADMIVTEINKEFTLDVVSEYSGEYTAMFRYKNGQIYIEVQSLVGMAEFIGYEILPGGGVRMNRGGFAPEVVFYEHEVIAGDDHIWYVAFDKAMNELAITCQYYEKYEKLLVYPLDDNIYLLEEPLQRITTHRGYQMHSWRTADFYGLEQSVLAAKLVDYTRNWGKIPTGLVGMDDFERLDYAVKNILVPNANNYYVCDDVVKTLNNLAKLESKFVGDTVDTIYGIQGVWELFNYGDGLVKNETKILDIMGDGTKALFGGIANIATVSQIEDLTNLIIFSDSMKQVNASVANGFKLIEPWTEQVNLYLYNAVSENLRICGGDGSAVVTAIARQFADGAAQLTMDLATDGMMSLWVDCANWITEETMGTQTQVNGVLNAWANLTIQDACKDPIETLKIRYKKADDYVSKCDALHDLRDVALVHMYAALNAQAGFGDQMDNSDMINEISLHIFDLLQYDDMEFNIAKQVDKAEKLIADKVWNSIIPFEVYWDQDFELTVDVKADLPSGTVTLNQETGSFNKTNGFPVVISQYQQSGYRMYGVADSDNTVEIYVRAANESDAWSLAYMDIEIFIGGKKLDNPYQYKDWDDNGEYLKFVFKNGIFQQ